MTRRDAATKPRIKHLVGRGWNLHGVDAARIDERGFEALMLASVAAGLVREWDDGRGRCPWYNARRGAEERALRDRCSALLGAQPVRPGSW